jgi:hypothetical protein
MPLSHNASSEPIPAAPDFDIREARTGAVTLQKRHVVAPTAQQNAINALRERVQDVKIEWSTLTRSPNRIRSRTQALTGPSGAPARDIAIDFLNQNLDIFNLTTSDISEIRFTRDARARNSGVTYVSIQQQANGRDVFEAVININVDREGRILNINGELIPRIHSIINTDIPVISEDEAMEAAARSAMVTHARQTRISNLVFFPINLNEARLAWDVIVEDADTPNVYQTKIDAVDGTVLFRRNQTQYAHGLVYTSDSPDPDTPTGTSNCTTNPYPACAVDREDVDFDGSDFFPVGDDHRDWWNDSTGSADTSTTKSNNVHAKEDRDYDNDDTEGFPTVAGDDFSFTIDLSQEPTVEDATVQNQSAGIVNAFYRVNRIHDIYYSLGFDEAEGNFQSDNFGLGGSGGDPVQVDIQDRLSTSTGYIYHCNGAFNTPADGSEPRMTLLLCDNSTPETDDSLENLIIIHEYTHGLVRRIVTNIGPYTSQSGGLQDGTCDFMGLAITSETDDDLTLNYPRGQWYYNNVNGNRRQPYSTNQTVFTRTYADISDDPAPWPAGEIWANTLWMARANLVWRNGFGSGGDTMLQLVVDGMKNERNHPDYLDMRDGILQADNTNNAGANQCILWDAFAKMGMGDSASTTGESDNNPVEAFDVPAECEPDILITPDLDFGNVCVDGSRTNLIRLDNTDDTGDLIVSSISRIAGNTDITVDPLPHPMFISPGAHVDISVTCQPTTCGPKAATIRIESNDPDQPQVDLDFICDGDELSPEINCPTDTTVECSTSTEPASTGTATATDVCDASVDITYADSITPGACPQEHTITRTWTGTDDCGLSDTCAQTIQIVDTTAPLITCPADITIECDEPTDPSHTGNPTTADNCDSSPTITYSDVSTPGFCSEAETITRTWTVTDACGNSSSCDQGIEVVDTTPPQIHCNAPATVTPVDAPVSFTATSTDNCDGEPSVEITGYDCFKFTKKGKRIDKTESCVVEIHGDSVTIVDSGGDDDNIVWTVRASDNCGNVSASTCSVEVVNPIHP